MIATQSKSLAERPWLDPNATAQVVIDGVGKTFGACTAVDNVNLGIFKGEIFEAARPETVAEVTPETGATPPVPAAGGTDQPTAA